MNAPKHSEVTIKTQQTKQSCNCNANPVLEGAAVNQQIQHPEKVWPYFLNDRTFRTFLGGEGI
jgi:hypothetical protein